MSKPLFDLATSHAADLCDLISCVPAAIVSKTLVSQPGFRQVLFAMDAGQELSEHRAPFLALVQVIDGRMRMRVLGEEHEMTPTSWLVMPPDAPHDVRAVEPVRFLLTLVRSTPAAAG